jgi:hypothetical protein
VKSEQDIVVEFVLNDFGNLSLNISVDFSRRSAHRLELSIEFLEKWKVVDEAGQDPLKRDGFTT